MMTHKDVHSKTRAQASCRLAKVGGRFALVAAVGLAALVGTCGGAGTCVQAQCTSGASMIIALASLPAAGTTVTVCRNGECYTATLPALPAADVGNVGLTFTGDATCVVGILWREADGSVGLNLEWQAASPEAVVDGDHYVVRLTDPAGAMTTILDKTATYSSVPPDPNACSPSSGCRIVQLVP